MAPICLRVSCSTNNPLRYYASYAFFTLYHNLPIALQSQFNDSVIPSAGRLYMPSKVSTEWVSHDAKVLFVDEDDSGSWHVHDKSGRIDYCFTYRPDAMRMAQFESRNDRGSVVVAQSQRQSPLERSLSRFWCAMRGGRVERIGSFEVVTFVFGYMTLLMVGGALLAYFAFVVWGLLHG